DPVLQYLETLKDGEKPRRVVVARESESLRTVYPVVGGRGRVECLHDSGSQVVSTSKARAMELGLSWDPSVVIYMQSANGQVEKSLGICRDVPFDFGHMTVYLQVHVIENPAYDILLGRPFDAVTRCVAHNGRDGSQTLTLHCPNSDRTIVVPTSERG
ncbi:hypothetical protein K435DRAFT_586140, partial [Dendrothele bispora CBS 962.96]